MPSGQPFVRTRLLVKCAIALLFFGLSLLGLRVYLQYAAVQQFRSHMERLDARVHVVGYRDIPTGIGRLPILGELLTTRRQVELTVENVETLDDVLEAAAQYPALDRININTAVFGLHGSEGIVDRIRARQPDMDIVLYMPGPGLKPSAQGM